MSAKEEAFKNEFQFASSSIVAHIVRGVLVGIVVGCIVSSFRFLIEHIFHFVQGVYKEMSGQPLYLLAMLLGYGVIVLIAGRLIRTNREDVYKRQAHRWPFPSQDAGPRVGEPCLQSNLSQG